MHRIEEQIAQWKKQIAQTDSLNQSDLAELEQHLRDSAADLQKRGLSQEEAFLIASTRLGANDALATEYCKVNGSYVWRKRVFWMLAGYLALRVAGTWIGTISAAGSAAAAYVGANGTIMGSIAVGLTCAGWASLLVALYALAMLGGPGITRLLSHTSSAAIAICVVGAIVVGALLSAGGQVVAVRLVSAEVFGQSAIVAAYASYALQLLIPLACIFMMWSLRRRGYGILPQHTE